ncbi:hypothetical protein D3C76_1730940 [compost metagenome]
MVTKVGGDPAPAAALAAVVAANRNGDAGVGGAVGGLYRLPAFGAEVVPDAE